MNFSLHYRQIFLLHPLKQRSDCKQIKSMLLINFPLYHFFFLHSVLQNEKTKNQSINQSINPIINQSINRSINTAVTPDSADQLPDTPHSQVRTAHPATASSPPFAIEYDRPSCMDPGRKKKFQISIDSIIIKRP